MQKWILSTLDKDFSTSVINATPLTLFTVTAITKSQLCLSHIITPTLADCLCKRMHDQHIFHNVLAGQITYAIQCRYIFL